MVRKFKISRLGAVVVAGFVVLLAGGYPQFYSASASTIKSGTVNAQVAECPPGAWNNGKDIAVPAMVVVLRSSRTLQGKSVFFSRGRFSGP
jgi:hypothetical protein